MTTATPFSLIEDGQTHEIEATLADGAIRIAPGPLRSALGWELKPEGLCRGEVCVSTAEHATLVDDRGVDLGAFTQLLGLPLAVNTEERVACIGRSAVEHAGVLASGAAPDFTLPDLNGTFCYTETIVKSGR